MFKKTYLNLKYFFLYLIEKIFIKKIFDEIINKGLVLKAMNNLFNSARVNKKIFPKWYRKHTYNIIKKLKKHYHFEKDYSILKNKQAYDKYCIDFPNHLKDINDVIEGEIYKMTGFYYEFNKTKYGGLNVFFSEEIEKCSGNFIKIVNKNDEKFDYFIDGYFYKNLRKVFIAVKCNSLIPISDEEKEIFITTEIESELSENLLILPC